MSKNGCSQDASRRRRQAKVKTFAAALLGVASISWSAAAAPAQSTMQTVIVTMRPGPAVAPAPGGQDGGRIADTLRRRSADHQRGLRSALRAQGARGRVRSWTPLWIVDAVEVTATPDVLAELARRPDVASVTPNRVAAIAPTAVPLPEPGIALVGAPDAWALGHTGRGVVVASLDTGVDVTHPALAASWRGGTNSWFDPYGEHPTVTVPFDPIGHGTSTAGVMVGANGIGMAPDARWIAARVFNDANFATIGEVHKAFQWVLDPDGNPLTHDAPSIVLNSWNGTNLGVCDPMFQPDLQALAAAGILAVFAAGNEGPGAGWNASPANLPEAFAVGATDVNDVIAPFSSRGPSSCKRSEVPAVTAPGVGVRTSVLSGGFASQDGTSFSAPHVAGAAALILSAAPGTTAVGVRDVLTKTAKDLGPVGLDDTYGFGRIDTLAAIQAATALPPVVDTVPPDTLQVVATPAALSSGPVTVAAIVTDAASPVASAEAFLDVAGASGSGIALAPVDGAFDTQTERVGGALPAGMIAAAAVGHHQILVRGKDAAGNWGPVAAAAFTIDRDGPTVTGGFGAPAVATRGDRVIATLGAADPANGADPPAAVAQAEVTVDAAAGPAAAIAAVDGALDSSTEALRLTIDTATLAPGSHQVAVRVRDAVGNWGAPRVSTVEVRPAGELFADGFESGGTARWSQRVGSPKVVRRARVAGSFGLAVSATGRSRLSYLEDASPERESAYLASVAVDARTVVARPRDILTGIDTGGATVFAIQLTASRMGVPSVRAVAGGAATRWQRLRRGVATVGLEWRSASSGSLVLSVAGTRLAPLPVAGSARLDGIRLGAVSPGVRGDRGELRLDTFWSSRLTDGDLTVG